MNSASQPKPKRRWCQARPWTVLLALLVLTGCGPSKEQRAIDAYSRGDAHFDKGELDEPIADYTEAIRLKPEDALAYSRRGSIYEMKGEPDLALVEDLTKVSGRTE
ncbi:tetratricopeptide repeat protein [Planctomycetota bacterium]